MAGQRRISGRAIAAAAGIGLAAPLVLAGTASAHTHTWSVTCSQVTIDLENYAQDHKNTVTLKIGADTVLNQDFGTSLQKTFPIPAHTADVVVELQVLTDQDPKQANGWSFDETKTSSPCPPPPPSPSPVSPSPSAPSHSPTPTHTTAKPSPTGPQLASTGGGSDAGLIAGIGAGVLVIGAGVVYATRRRPGRH